MNGRLILLVCGFFLAARPLGADAPAPWSVLSAGGHFAMVRHALAPGGGDPKEFTLDDCATQRNLNDAGRAQARRVGDTFRAGGITQARVFTSQWCRCRDTAAGMALGPVVDLPFLNSFHRTPKLKDERLAGLRKWLAEQPLDQPTVLVTHFTVISGLVDAGPRPGETVIVRREADGRFTVVATVAAD
ncbi:MAG: histidine phosphatase family protein [Rhodospirillales bacterium]